MLGDATPYPRPKTSRVTIRTAEATAVPKAALVATAIVATSSPSTTGRRRPHSSPSRPPVGLITIMPSVNVDSARPIVPVPHPRSSRRIGQTSSSAYWANTANAWVEKAATNIGFLIGGATEPVDSVDRPVIGVCDRIIDRGGHGSSEHDEHHDDDRQVDREDRPPTERREQEPADDRPEAGAGADHRTLQPEGAAAGLRSR